MFPGKGAVVAGAGNSFFYITIFVIILILLAIGAVGIVILIRHLQFNKKIEIYEWRNGKPERIGKDRAKELKYNVLGDSVFYLKKRHKYLPRGVIKMGKNLYFYVIRDDGEWVNFTMGDINQRFNEADVKFIHPDMRAFKSGLVKVMKDRFEKKKGIKDILLSAMPYIFIILCAIALYFIADRLVAFLDKLPQVVDKLDSLLGKMNNICSPPSYVPVT